MEILLQNIWEKKSIIENAYSRDSAWKLIIDQKSYMDRMVEYYGSEERMSESNIPLSFEEAKKVPGLLDVRYSQALHLPIYIFWG